VKKTNEIDATCDTRCGSDRTCKSDKKVRVTVEVCDYKIFIERGSVKTCKSDTSIGNDKIHDWHFSVWE
jgi:hypothetical protein